MDKRYIENLKMEYDTESQNVDKKVLSELLDVLRQNNYSAIRAKGIINFLDKHIELSMLNVKVNDACPKNDN